MYSRTDRRNGDEDIAKLLFRLLYTHTVGQLFQKINVYKEKAHPIIGQNSLALIRFVNIIKVLERISPTSIINYAGDLIIIIMRPKTSLTHYYAL